jgi:mRNA-degrading endonuclease toxin of MazEF toxin-antitoxin module
LVNAFTPAEGDIVWLEFDPQVGHEQAGHRPALVLTPERYNAMRGMMLCCPMTTKVKGYVFAQESPHFDNYGSAIFVTTLTSSPSPSKCKAQGEKAVNSVSKARTFAIL